MMRRPVKVKAAANRMPLRKTATSASAAARRSFPAWIDDGDTIAFTAARTATQRVRVGLILRKVSKGKSVERRVAHGSSSR